MYHSTLAKRGILLLLIAVVVAYFYGLGHLPLVGPDEPRYAEVAREMFLRRDLVTPTLGGFPWFEKPALLYWMMIASFKLFGESEWAIRLPAALCGLLTIAGVYFIGSQAERFDETLRGYAFWSTLAAATTIGIVVFSRAASFDIVLTMTTTWALGFYLAADLELDYKGQRWLLAGFYSFVGLSLLAKGLVGIVIPAGVALFYHLFCRKLPRRNAIGTLVWGIPLALLVAATWYAPVIWRHGWTFVDQFFIQQHFARYVSNKYRHAQPVFYYIAIIPLLVLPWNAFLFDALARARLWPWRTKAPVSGRGDDVISRLMIFALAWALFPFLFFSFASSKLPGYVLPILPAAALIVGQRFWRVQSHDGNSNWAVRITGLLCILFAVGGLGYAWRSHAIAMSRAIVMGLPLFIAGCFALFARYRSSLSVILIAVACFMVLMAAVGLGASQIADRQSSKRLLQVADSRGYGQTVIYGMQRRDRSPEFYAAGRITYGPDGEPIMYEGPWQVIAESERRGAAVLTFVTMTELPRLTGTPSVETDVIADNGRHVLVAIKARKPDQ